MTASRGASSGFSNSRGLRRGGVNHVEVGDGPLPPSRIHARRSAPHRPPEAAPQAPSRWGPAVAGLDQGAGRRGRSSAWRGRRRRCFSPSWVRTRMDRRRPPHRHGPPRRPCAGRFPRPRLSPARARDFAGGRRLSRAAPQRALRLVFESDALCGHRIAGCGRASVKSALGAPRPQRALRSAPRSPCHRSSRLPGSRRGNHALWVGPAAARAGHRSRAARARGSAPWPPRRLPG